MRIRTIARVAKRVTVGFVCLLTVMSPSLAHAGDPSNQSALDRTHAEMAQTRHRDAVAAYAKGHYRNAIDLFLEANRLRPSAALSFNVARCYEQLDDISRALDWYRDYQRRSGAVSDDKQLARHIARLEQRLARNGVQRVTADSAPSDATLSIDRDQLGVAHALDVELAPASESAVEETPPQAGATGDRTEMAPQRPVRTIVSVRPKREEMSTLPTTLGWTSLIAGGAALGGALAFELLRRGAEQDAQREPRQIQFAHDIERMRSRQMVARVLGGAGAALAVAGGILLLVGSGHSARVPDARATLACAPYRCQASLTGRF